MCVYTDQINLEASNDIFFLNAPNAVIFFFPVGPIVLNVDVSVGKSWLVLVNWCQLIICSWILEEKHLYTMYEGRHGVDT